MSDYGKMADDELDVLVERRVFGRVPCDKWEYANLGSGGGAIAITRCTHATNCYSTNRDLVHPLYCHSLAAAWLIVERLASAPDCVAYPFILREDRYNGSYSGGKWLASFGTDDGTEYNEACGGDNDAMEYWDGSIEWWGGRKRIAAANHPARAIVLAALMHGDTELK